MNDYYFVVTITNSVSTYQLRERFEGPEVETVEVSLAMMQITNQYARPKFLGDSRLVCDRGYGDGQNVNQSCVNFLTTAKCITSENEAIRLNWLTFVYKFA